MASADRVPLMPRVVGHRGAAAAAPENTLAGFRAAAACGTRWVEVDVALTADGVPVLLHDETLDRTSNGKGSIAAMRAADVARLDAGSWFSPRFAGEPMPTLEAALAEAARLGLGLNLEIKPTPGLSRETARATCAMVRRLWPARMPRPVLSSFQLDALEEAKAVAAELPRGLLLESDWPGGAASWVETARRLGCAAIHPKHSMVDRAAARTVTGDGFTLAVYTVNDGARARDLVALGVDTVITDEPEAILAALAA